MAYTVKSGDNWFSIAQRVFGDQRFAARLRDRNRGVTLSPGVRIKTGGIDVSRIGGGAALATFAGISPTGVAPTPGAVTPAGEALGIPIEIARAQREAREGVTAERPPAELAPQALMPGTEQLGAEAPVTVQAERKGRRPYGVAPERVEVQELGGLPAPGIVPYEAPPPPAYYTPPLRQDLPEGIGPTTYIAPPPPSLGLFGLGPVVEGLATGLGAGFEQIGEAFAPSTVQVMGGTRPPGEAGRHAPAGAEYVSPTPSAQDTAPMPTGQYVSGRVAIAQAATWTARALSYAVEQNNRNYMPEVITSPVATLILSSTDIETFAGENITSLNELFASDALGYTEIEPGVWAKNSEVTYTGGYTGAIGYGGRRYGRGRGTRGGGGGGAGGVQYGPRLVQWRIAGFG